MAKQTINAAGRVAAVALAILLCAPLVAAQVNGNYVTGTVQSVNRDLNYITVTDPSGRPLKIDVRRMNTGQSVNVWNLRPGDAIAVNGGWENNGVFEASTVNYGRAGMANNPNVLYGTVAGQNRKLNYVTVRDQSGHEVKVDVRGMDTRRSTNVWNLRNGDPIEVAGAWENGNTFRASRVNFSNNGYRGDAPANGTYANNANFISGTVQSVNRDLNYLTVRDDATGASVKIDVRSMNTGRSVNVWRLRPGDHVSVNGGWENRDMFSANSVN
ncbi:MAG TPA: hypothetical protein VHY33_13660 [Thermoanaerobaculia bacterium]|nr:hypothetical protein [Thermoanaerobaculia bacterium]